MDLRAGHSLGAFVGQEAVVDRSPVRSLKVQKFGGTTVGTVDGLRSVVSIVREASLAHRVIVVVSAVRGVTDMLEEASAGPVNEISALHRLVDRLWRTHHVLASGVLESTSLRAYESILEQGIRDVIGLLGKLHRTGVRRSPLQAQLLATGERLSVPLLVMALQQEGVVAVAQDATELIRTDSSYEEAVVDGETTQQLVRDWHSQLRPEVVPVVTGFIGADPSGRVTTLGRSGSDYSAALLASALGATVMERWTDVDGLYTEDPRANHEAEPLALIAFEDALMRNHAGKLGMHRKALDPVDGRGITVHVRSTAAPDKRGTLILPRDQQSPSSGLSA